MISYLEGKMADGDKEAAKLLQRLQEFLDCPSEDESEFTSAVQQLYGFLNVMKEEEAATEEDLEEAFEEEPKKGPVRLIKKEELKDATESPPKEKVVTLNKNVRAALDILEDARDLVEDGKAPFLFAMNVGGEVTFFYQKMYTTFEVIGYSTAMNEAIKFRLLDLDEDDEDE
jgi:hypothetical protein